MLGRRQWTRILWVGVLEAAVVLAVFLAKLRTTDAVEARTFAFSTLVFCELFRSFAARSRRLVFWQVGALLQSYSTVIGTEKSPWIPLTGYEDYSI